MNLLKNKLKKKAPVAVAPSVEENDEEEEEVVEEVAPAKKGLKSLKKKAAPVQEEAEEEDEDDSEDGEEEAVEEVAPAPKKGGLKSLKKKAAPVVVDDEPEDEEETADEDAEDSEEEEVVEEKVPAKKGKLASKKKAAPVQEEAEEEDDSEDGEEEAPAPKKGSKSTLFSSKKSASAKEARVLREGDVMTRDEFLAPFAKEMGISMTDARTFTSALEEHMSNMLSQYQFNFMGVRFKRTVVDERLFQGCGGLKIEGPESELVTKVFPHVQASLRITKDRVSTKGIIDDNGEFVEGNFDDKGNFVEGTWSPEKEGSKKLEFTAKPKKAGKKK